MANHKGSEGYVKVGTPGSDVTIAEVRDWSLTMTSDTVEDSTMGDAARTYQATLTSASGSVTCFWDETDTTGQGALTAGSEVTLNLYPEGDTAAQAGPPAVAADTYYSMTAIITEEAVSASFDGMVESSFSFQVTGAVTVATVV